jgi:hypothetical protein
VAADDLGTARAVKWAEIKAIRDQLESGGFELAAVGRFDSDAESRARIVGASMAAKIARDAGQPYSINWTLANNTTVELDADAVINVGCPAGPCGRYSPAQPRLMPRSRPQRMPRPWRPSAGRHPRLNQHQSRRARRSLSNPSPNRTTMTVDAINPA